MTTIMCKPQETTHAVLTSLPQNLQQYHAHTGTSQAPLMKIQRLMGLYCTYLILDANTEQLEASSKNNVVKVQLKLKAKERKQKRQPMHQLNV